MKIKNTFILLIIFSSISNLSIAQEDKTVTLTVSGQGKTLEAAKQSALRSAIEQAFGTFISSKTEILNDNLISDQITSIANGNIQKFESMSEVQIPDGGYATTLKATVSVTKLTSFAESKGVVIEFKGSLLAANIKLQILNEENETKAVKNLCAVLKQILDKSIDYSLTSAEPQAIGTDNQNWNIPITVNAKFNPNINLFNSYLFSTLKNISLAENDKEEYKKIGKQIYKIAIGPCPDLKKEYVIYKNVFVDETGKYERGGIVFKTTDYEDFVKQKRRAEKREQMWSSGNAFTCSEEWPQCNNVFAFRTLDADAEIIKLINSTLNSVLKFEINNGLHTITGTDLIEAEHPMYHDDYDIKNGFETKIDLQGLEPFLSCGFGNQDQFWCEPEFKLKAKWQGAFGKPFNNVSCRCNRVREDPSGAMADLEAIAQEKLNLATTFFGENVKDGFGYVAVIILTSFNPEKEKQVKIKFEDKISLADLSKIAEYKISRVQ